MVKGIFVNRELLVLFPVNCEITFEYDDDSSGDNDSVHVLEQDSAEPQLLNKELGFLLNQSKKNLSYKNAFFFSWNVKCERANLFSRKRDQYPSPTPFTTLFWTNFGKLENALQTNPYFERRWAWEKGF